MLKIFSGLRKNIKIAAFGIAAAIVVCLFAAVRTFAADTQAQAASSTPSATPSPSPVQSAEQVQLQQQLQVIEDQITQYQQQVGALNGQKNTLQNKLNQLRQQQALTQLQVQAEDIQITELGAQITVAQAQVDQDAEKVSKLQDQITQLIRIIAERDEQPLVYAFVSQSSLSDVWSEIQDDSKITGGLSALSVEVESAAADLARQRADLAKQQDAIVNTVSIQAIQQAQLGDSIVQQAALVKQTSGRESVYQAVLKSTQAQAAQIRSRLYDLLGVSSQIDFGSAVQIADYVSAQTGVRPAFLLAILTQESNLGKNVGTCNRAGDPPSKSWRVVMKPNRDQQPFVQITQSLGMDTDTTPVSCPMHDGKGRQVGWGGAMGPAQFIPSTWVGYAPKVAAITGKTANPWDIRDAFLAAGIKLAANGATTQAGEWAAAMRYFSGSTNPAYSFYGDSVVAQAAKYQQDIDSMGK